ncbi:uncharacterized protein LOC144105172 [Amblyomma americanum]
MPSSDTTNSGFYHACASDEVLSSQLAFTPSLDAPGPVKLACKPPFGSTATSCSTKYLRGQHGNFRVSGHGDSTCNVALNRTSFAMQNVGTSATSTVSSATTEQAALGAYRLVELRVA